jgi:Type II secretion system (T2SS), protein M subtype b
MTLGQRDRRALLVLGGAAIVCLVLWMLLPAERQPALVGAVDTIPAAAKRLSKVRQVAATLPAEERSQQTAAAQLAAREKGMLQADTPAQAQAQLVQIMRRLASAQEPPIEIRSAEVGKTQPLGDSYGEVTIPVSFVCRIDQLVNLLADVTAQPELLAAGGLRITPGDAKEKTINVRLTLSAIAPRKLVPEKRGTGLL